MQFLSLYTSATPASGPPSAEHMAKMGKLMEEMFKAGVLIAAGGIMSRNSGMKVTRQNGAFAVQDGAVSGSSLMPASGYALLRASSRDELVQHLQKFLEMAGDGTCEIIQVLDAPSPSS